MSKIKISPIEEVPEITEETHEPDEAAGPVDSVSAAAKADMPAPKPKRIRKKPETKEETPPPPPEPEPIPEQKQGKLITCTNCGKELLEKTFKYYHQLKCKPKETSHQHPVLPFIKSDSITVDFGFQRRQQKQERFTNLIANAF
jgi:hypothetical protein